MSLPSSVKIVEVAPRDGLQNESAFVPTDVKIELVNRLSQAGFRNIESASFVSPKWVPQMADGADVMAGIARRAGTIYSALTPNLRGFEAALAAKVDEVAIFGSASEAFCQRNINCSIEEAIARFAPVADAARDAGIRLRGSISCAFHCPYQGKVDVASTVNVARQLLALGCVEIDICDTIGAANAREVDQVMRAVSEWVDPAMLSGHFHDTYGQGVANVYAALQAGISIIHASTAGLGGCPYAKGATGNVATEDVLYLLQGLNIETGIDLDSVVDTGQWISSHLGRKASSNAGNALTAKKPALQ